MKKTNKIVIIVALSAALIFVLGGRLTKYILYGNEAPVLYYGAIVDDTTSLPVAGAKILASYSTYEEFSPGLEGLFASGFHKTTAASDVNGRFSLLLGGHSHHLTIEAEGKFRSITNIYLPTTKRNHQRHLTIKIKQGCYRSYTNELLDEEQCESKYPTFYHR